MQIISGAELRARREALGLSRIDLGAVAGPSAGVIAKIERDTVGITDTRRALLADALTRLEHEAERVRLFPDVEPRPVAGARTRPWPSSVRAALLGFRTEGVEAGADVVAVSCSGRLHLVIGSSRLGNMIVAASTGCSEEVDAITHAVLMASSADEALESVALSDQVGRALRAACPPLRVLHRAEPAIVGHRDSGTGRVALNLAAEPAAAPPVPVAATPSPASTRSRKPARRTPREARQAALA